jgi:hypothetical protein
MWQVLLFECSDPEDLDRTLRGLASFATFRAESGFYFYSQRSGEPEFQFDCELINGGLITDREGDYFSFLGHFIDALTVQFGALELGPDGALPRREL